MGVFTKPCFGNESLQSLSAKHFGTPSLIELDQPLKCPTNIRLLKILPTKKAMLNEDNAPVKLFAIETSMEDAPGYCALSYTWGDDTDRRTVTCGNETREITRNLELALAGIRDSDPGEAESVFASSGYIWADSLCINQKDPEEKQSQILLMPRIYQRATKVIAFLTGVQNSQRIKHALDHIVDLERVQRIIHEGFYDKSDKPPSNHHGRSYWHGKCVDAAGTIGSMYLPVRQIRTMYSVANNTITDIKNDIARKKAPPPRPGEVISKEDLLRHSLHGVDYGLLDEIFRSPWYILSCLF